ncbi:TorF family putative porin [Parathalassolituus penaei]|uniref:TorF family putative porin n=1 Tax=Parathalassolituus penaei TaxID=2997323 RepID=A0A9X3EFS6_9GAMM|nr:TorF family putative porin [Parathalassolituus penaei]MCY0966747.1 TorF family putative porin [Parathalassolituus penaei]
MLPVRTLAILAASAPALLASSASLAGGQANIGLVSEYMRDGISYTAGEYAFQAGADYTHSSGLYGGIAASEVKHQYETGHYERDLFAGWYIPLTDDIAVDAGVTRYTFQGDRYGNEKDYSETFARALYNDRLTLGWRQSAKYLGSDFAKRTVEVAYTLPLNTFGIEFYTAQHRYLEVNDDYNFGGNNRSTYWHFRIAGERTYNKYDYRLSLERTNLTSEYDAGTIIQFGIHRYFDLF